LKRVVCFGVMALWAGAATASPVDQFGIGARTSAFAGAGTASATDFSANHFNPAGLAEARRTQLSFGFQTALPRAAFGERRSRLPSAPAFTGGLVAPGTLFGVPFAFGLALRLPKGRVSHSESIADDEPTWILFQTRPLLLYLSSNVAIEPWPGFSLGAGVGFLASTRGGFRVRGKAYLPGLGASLYESDLEHAIDAELTSRRYPQAGVRYRPDDDWAFGVSYRGSASVDVELAAELRGELAAGTLSIPVLYRVLVTSLDRFLPRQARLGVSRRLLRRLSLHAEVVWSDWSDFPTPFDRTESVLELEPPDGIELALPPAGANEPPPAPAFHDTVSPRLGCEWRVPLKPPAVLALRAGYRYEPSVTDSFLLVDADRHALAFGLGVDEVAMLEDGVRLSFDAYAEHSSWTARSVVSSSATGSSSVESAGTVEADGRFWALGADVTASF
jgi:long-chain fatty acid transport protein